MDRESGVRPEESAAEDPRRPTTPSIPLRALGICAGGLLVLGALAAVLFHFIAASRQSARTTDCRNTLKQIGIYFSLYESKFKTYPPSLRTLYRPDLATDPNLFICPHSPQRFQISSGQGMRWEDFEARVSYGYRPPGPIRSGYPPAAESEVPPAEPMLWDKNPHPDGKRCVMFANGTLEMLDEPAFQAALRMK